MAKTIEDLIVKLKAEGFEHIDKLRGSFRELNKVTNATEAQLERTRKEIIDFGKESTNSIAVIQGQITALKGLQRQADINGTVFKNLRADVKAYEAQLKSAEAQLDSFNTKVQSAASVQSRFEKLGVPGLENQLSKRRDLLAQQTPLTNEYVTSLGGVIKVETALTRLYERQAVIAASARSVKFTPARGGTQDFDIEGLIRYAGVFQTLPNTNAAYAQALKELRQDLANLDRGTNDYLNTLLRLTYIQREASRVTQGFAQALVHDLDTGRAARSTQNLDEAIGALRAEMAQLDTATSAGSAAYARNANAVSRLQKQLDAIAQSYKNVTSSAAQATNAQSSYANTAIVANYFNRPAVRAAEQVRAAQSVPMPPREISGLYNQIGQIGMQPILNSIEMMGESYESVANDIRKATAASNGSTNSLQAQRAAWEALRNTLGDNKLALREIDKELNNVDRQLAKRGRGGGRLSGMQLAQGVGAALTGGIFGGPEGFIGGLGGLAVGGVGGAFAGAAFGAQVGMVRQQIGVFTEQAAAISKLRIGLASVSTDLREFEASTRAVEGASQSLLIPLADTYRYYTQLRASTVELNYSANDTRQILEGTASAVLKTGGSLVDVDGAMRAVVQILSKGKAAAEEVRGQLGERFPGAVIKFAQANRMSVQELDQAFQAGSVTIEQFITFARKNYEDGGKYVENLANSTEYAGRRMEKALENLRLAVGRSLKESGAGFQNFAAEAAESLLWLGQQLSAFGDAAERALGGTPGPTGNAKEIAERIIGGGTTVAAIEEAIRTYEGKVQEAKDRLNAVKTRNIFQFIFDETFGQGTPTQQQTGKTVASFESRINSLREALKLADDYTRRGKRGAGSGSEDPAAADRAKSLLSAIEQREEALAQARIQREEQLADIRKQAVEQVRQLERQFADERLTAERAIARNRRELSDLQAAAQLSFRAETEQNPYLVDAERGISEILRKSREDRIRIDEEYSDKQTQRARLLADFQKKVADDINKANEAYAKQIGNIQREYAKNVAKIIEEGTNVASKRLETAGKIAGLYMQRAAINARFATGTGLVAAEPGRQTSTTFTAEELLTSQYFAAYKLSLSNIAEIDKQIQALQGRLQQLKPLVPPAPTTSPMRSLPMSKQFDIPGTAALNRSTAEQRGTEERLVTEQEAAAIRDRFTSITEESNKQVQNLQEQNVLLNLQAKYLNTGVNTELARQFAQEELNYTKRRARLDAERQEAIRQGFDVKTINALYEGRLSVLNDQYSVLMRQTEELDKQQRLLRLRQDDRIGLGIREGAQKYVESIGTMREATAQLAQTGIKGVEDAIFSLVTTGTANFREFAKQILENTARMIIQQLILRTVMQAIGAIGGGGGSALAKTFEMPGAGFPTSGFKFANGGAFASNGIVPFAMGGVVNRPTMFAFANGGVGRLGLMGEAEPEAIMPLRRLPSGKLGVGSTGGGAVTVNVSVDATGSQVQGDGGQGAALGRAVASAVQAELIKQRRPGGILAA